MKHDSTATIFSHLDALAAERGIRILLAVESGSRAWGCPSPDSDYDVRVVYAHPRETYLAVSEPADQLSYFALDGELDVNGWDLRKCLRLAGSSNATPGEWAQSPMVYREVDGFRENLLDQAHRYANPVHLVNHYRGIARNSFGEAVVGGPIKLKKLCYVLRPILAARFVRAQKILPPMTFDALLPSTGDDVVERRIRDLLEKKAALDESHVGTLDPILGAYVERELEELARPYPFGDVGEVNRTALDVTFRHWINGA